MDDEADFQSTCAALDMLGVGPRHQVEVFTVLAAILHLGNIEVHGNHQDKGVTKVRGVSTVLENDINYPNKGRYKIYILYFIYN